MPSRCTITLRTVAAPATALRLLRREFPDVPLGEHRRRIQAGEPVYSSEREESRYIDVTRLTALLRRFDEAGVEVTLSEETFRNGRWEPLSESRSQLRRILGNRFQMVSWGPGDSKTDNIAEIQQNAIKEETIVIVLDPGKLENPDLDLRYDVSARIEAVTDGAVRNGGYDYIDPPPDSGPKCWRSYGGSGFWTTICPGRRRFTSPPSPGWSWRTASGCIRSEKICLSADFPLDFSAGLE